MGLSKVYKGYVIEDVNGQWYIRNAPTFTNGFPFSPGPHGGWTVATHQVDKLIEYINRGNDTQRGKYPPAQPEPRQQFYNSSSSSSQDVEETLFEKIASLVILALFVYAVLSGMFGSAEPIGK